MKKICLMLGVVAMFGMASCHSDKTRGAEAEPAVEDAVEPAETVAIDPYIAALMESDSLVKVTESGLGYKVIKEGEGDHPAITSTANVVYVGRHTDGSEFDNSHGNAVAFPLNAVIPGFTEGLMLMNKGAVYELYIPGNLGYGPRGIPGVIEPNELLVFEVTLEDFN